MLTDFLSKSVTEVQYFIKDWSIKTRSGCMLDIPQYSVNWCGSARQARCINSYDEGFYFISDELLAPHKYGGGGG